MSELVGNIFFQSFSKKANNEEYLELRNSLEKSNKKKEYFYDGIEEILSNSDDEKTNNNEDDERLFNDDDRISFTREQLVEYQQLTKLLRFVKVCLIKMNFFFNNNNSEWWSVYNTVNLSITT